VTHDPRAFWEGIAAAREAVEVEVDEADEPLEIIEPSRPATVEDLNPSTTKNLAWLATGGWWSASQVTRVFLAGTVYKTGKQAGETRPDKTMTNLFTDAAHPDGRQVQIWYQDGSLRSALVRTKLEPWRKLDKVGDLLDFISGGGQDGEG
jgi:hypothetical protein